MAADADDDDDLPPDSDEDEDEDKAKTDKHLAAANVVAPPVNPNKLQQPKITIPAPAPTDMNEQEDSTAPLLGDSPGGQAQSEADMNAAADGLSSKPMTPRDRFRNRGMSLNSKPTTPRADQAEVPAIARGRLNTFLACFSADNQGSPPEPPKPPELPQQPELSKPAEQYTFLPGCFGLGGTTSVPEPETPAQRQQVPIASGGIFGWAKRALAPTTSSVGSPIPRLDLAPSPLPSSRLSTNRTSRLRTSALEAVRNRMYELRGITSDTSLAELHDLILDQPWFEAEGFHERCGFCAIASGLLCGITSPLYVIRDVYGAECGEAASDIEARGLIDEMVRKDPRKKFSLEAVWDSEDAVALHNAFNPGAVCAMSATHRPLPPPLPLLCTCTLSTNAP